MPCPRRPLDHHRCRDFGAMAVVLVLLASGAVVQAVERDPAIQELVDQFRQLADLTKLVQEEYVHPITRDELWQGAFRGMLDTLDAHSTFLAADEVLLQAQTRNDARHGFGFDWRPDPAEQRYVISRVIPGSPAAQAGIVPGDSLLAVDGVVLADQSRHAVRRHMFGLGETCSLQVRHADGSTAEVDLGKADFADTGVASAQLLDRDFAIGLIHCSRFIGAEAADRPTVTGAAFRAALDRLQDQGLRGLIVDLRGNGGGSLPAAVAVADCFLDARPGEGTLIVSQVSRHPSHQQQYRAQSSTSYPGWPLIVLIDAATASSAEICAAAWQDHGRAVLVGEPTTGKIAVQQQFALPDGSAIRLTVAHYRTPEGRNLSDEGVSPDISVPTTDADRLASHRAATLTDRLVVDPPLRRARELLIAMLLDRGNWHVR